MYNTTNCDEYYTSGEPRPAGDKTVEFNLKFGPTKSVNYNTETTGLAIQLWPGPPTPETSNVTITMDVQLKEMLKNDLIGKKKTYDVKFADKLIYSITYKVQFSSTTARIASTILMVVMFAFLWSYNNQ